MTDITRRKFLSLAPASVGAIALGGVAALASPRSGPPLLYVNNRAKKVREFGYANTIGPDGKPMFSAEAEQRLIAAQRAVDPPVLPAPKEPRTKYVAEWASRAEVDADPESFAKYAEMAFRRTEKLDGIKLGPIRRDHAEESRPMYRTPPGYIAERWPDAVFVCFAADVMEA